MNRAKGARLRVSAVGADLSPSTSVMNNLGRVDVRRQHLPLYPGRLRGVRAARSHPERRGLSADLATEMGALKERITTTQNGSITSVQAIYVPADDFTDPAPATTFAHLDATTVLNRESLKKGFTQRLILSTQATVYSTPKSSVRTLRGRS